MSSLKAASRLFSWKVEVIMVGYVDHWIQDYLESAVVFEEKGGNSLLIAKLPDISAVYGLILKLRDSGINVISISIDRIDTDS